MPEGPIIHDAQGRPVPGSSDYGRAGKAVEETPEAKKRRVEKAWNDKFFSHLGLSGIGGAAAIEKYKLANPDWTKKRDTWAQAQSKASKARKAKDLTKKVQSGGGSVGSLIEEE